MKEKILKIYRNLAWGDKIPSCCFEEKVFRCPNAKRCVLSGTWKFGAAILMKTF